MTGATRSGFWGAAAILVATCALMLLVGLDLAEGNVDEAVHHPLPPPPPRTLDVDRAEALFAVQELEKLRIDQGGVSPFHTAFFQPPPQVRPTHQEVPVVYQGHLTTSFGLEKAFLMVGTNRVVVTNGMPVVADFVVSRIALRTLTLTGGEAGTTVLVFREPHTLRIPNP